MSESKLMFLHCLTNIHPGSGTALGFVDLPVQRERHTQWPVIPGTSLKGVLRASCSNKIKSSTDSSETTENDSDSAEYQTLLSVFGPETATSEGYAGAVSISDARILAYPVRSMRGVFAWTTCPTALKLLKRNLGLMGTQSVPDIPVVKPNMAICTKDSPLIVASENKILLEEFDFDLVPNDDSATQIAKWISEIAISDQDADTAERFQSHMVILSDDDFTHFTRFATEVTARIRLDYETKSVEQGALFYEETLPPETIFQAMAIATESRKKGVRMDALGILNWLRNNTPETLQIGAGETVGRGFCAVHFSDGVKKKE